MINLSDKCSVDEKINSMRKTIDEISNALWNARMYDSAYEFHTKMEEACRGIRKDLYNVFEKFTETLSEKTKECLAAGEMDEPKSTAGSCFSNDGTELFEPFVNDDSDESSDDSCEVKGTFAELLGNGLKSLGKCLNDICNVNSTNANCDTDICDDNTDKTKDSDGCGDFCKTLKGDTISMASDLMREYDEENIECPDEAEQPITDPIEISKAVIDVISDRKAHKYRFIKGENGASPAVEVIIEDKWNVGTRADLVQLACDDIKNIGDFSLVSMSSAANPGKLTFFLVLK